MADDQSMQNTSYFSVIPQDWIDDGSIKTVVVRCYASVLADDPKLADYATQVLRSFQTIIPGKSSTLFAKTENDEPVLSFEMTMAFRDGQVVVSAVQKAALVLAGGYIFLISPLSVDGGHTDESLVNRRADYTRGLLTVVFGHMAMLKPVFEHRYELHSPDKVSYVTPVVENHIPPASWFTFSNDTLINANEAVAAGDSEFIDRLELSLSFIGRAANELDQVVRFSHVWIALEIAAGGHAAAKNFLNGIEGFAHEAKRFADLRNSLFHHGKRFLFDQHDERLLCACVLACNLQNFGIIDAGFSAMVNDHLLKHPKP